MIVERLELRLLRLPLVRHFETSFGRSYDRLFLLVRVDGGGHTGWGECVAEHNPYYSSETTETAWHVISEFIAPLVVGAEFAHPRDIFPALARVRGHFMAKGVVEMAARDAAERLARNWTTVLLNGLFLIVAGVLIFSIDWSVRSLSTFIGVLFIFEGFWAMLTAGIDNRAANFVVGLLSVAAGVVIIAWPSPGLIVLGIFLGSWLIVLGTVTISGAFAARKVLPDWWLLLLIGLAEVPLGILALADPGATLAAIITVGGIYAVVIGSMRIVLAFQLKNLPKDVDEASAQSTTNGAAAGSPPARDVAGATSS